MSTYKLKSKLNSAQENPYTVHRIMVQNITLLKPYDRKLVWLTKTPTEAAQAFLESGRKFLGSSTKVELGEGFGYLTTVMYLAPARVSGMQQCAGSTPECVANCLFNKSGHILFHQAGSILKSWALRFKASEAKARIEQELELHALKAKHKGLKGAVRLNGTSDILHARLWRSAQALGLEAYEYTKLPTSIRRDDGVFRTYSISEAPSSVSLGLSLVASGGSAAIVVPAAKTKKKAMLELLTVLEIPWVDGDRHDLCFLDAGKLRVLKAKGIKETEFIWTADRFARAVSS